MPDARHELLLSGENPSSNHENQFQQPYPKKHETFPNVKAQLIGAYARAKTQNLLTIREEESCSLFQQVTLDVLIPVRSTSQVSAQFDLDRTYFPELLLFGDFGTYIKYPCATFANKSHLSDLC
jgi:hypothetical protein